jgi:glycolate oxidase
MDHVSLQSALARIVSKQHVLTGAAIADDYTHDEALTVTPARPDVLVRPDGAQQIADILRLASEARVPVTARGSGTGLSGACVAKRGGILLSFERMRRILEIDVLNQVAVVQPGVTLAQLEEATSAHGLMYPILPGEISGSLGGNVATNAGGMQAIKYGVTRNNVLGLELVLPSGEIIRTGGKLLKISSGLDLTQLVIGSEGTLAITTEITLRLRPRCMHRATLLLPFETLDAVMGAIPQIVASGVDPLVLEYIDVLTMAAITQHAGIELGVPQAIREKALAYLVLVLEGRSGERVSADLEETGTRALELGALDAFALSPQAGTDLLHAREQAFWTAKKAGANDIIDVVVPRAAMPEYLRQVGVIGQEHQTFIAGCGHAGDGNVHLSIFQPNAAIRSRVMKAIFAAGLALGGAISAEHGIGCEKMSYFLELESPTKLALMRQIKAAFDPRGILNPGTLFG